MNRADGSQDGEKARPVGSKDIVKMDFSPLKKKTKKSSIGTKHIKHNGKHLSSSIYSNSICSKV